MLMFMLMVVMVVVTGFNRVLYQVSLLFFNLAMQPVKPLLHA